MQFSRAVLVVLSTLAIVQCKRGATPAENANEGRDSGLGSGGANDADAGRAGSGRSNAGRGGNGPNAGNTPAAGSGGPKNTVSDAQVPKDAAADSGTATDANPPADSGKPSDAAPGQGTSTLVGVGSWGYRARSVDGAAFVICANPSTGNDHSPDLLRDVAYGAGVFIAVGGDRNAMVMRSLDAVHWQEDLHPTTGCKDPTYPSSCDNWMGAVAYHDGTWLAGGGNGALMRSTDGGLSWSGLHPKTTPNPIRYMAAGSGRFVVGTDGGTVAVSPDRGETFTVHMLAKDPLRIAHGAGAFIAWTETKASTRACFVSKDKGDTWNPCDAMVASSASFVHDGARWVVRVNGGFATSTDAVSWTAHTASGFPTELSFDGKTWFGLSGTTLSRGSSPETFKVVDGVKAPDARAWSSGIVLDSNLPVTSPPACQDNG